MSTKQVLTNFIRYHINFRAETPFQYTLFIKQLTRNKFHVLVYNEDDNYCVHNEGVFIFSFAKMRKIKCAFTLLKQYVKVFPHLAINAKLVEWDGNAMLVYDKDGVYEVIQHNDGVALKPIHS